MKKLSIIAYAMLAFIFCNGTSMAQNTKEQKKADEAAEIKRIINGKNFIFKANFAQPTGNASVRITGLSSLPNNNIANAISGAAVPLTSSYDLTLTNDTLSAFLPYYGVSYTAPPLGSTEGGVKFTTTKFDYKITQKKKGNIEILIKPLDLQPRAPSDVQRMTLTVSESGFANLQITLLNRQPISYTGSLEEVKPKKAS